MTTEDVRHYLLGLQQRIVTYTPEEERELLETIDECTDRLDQLVGNLLDMSRITADSVRPQLGPVRWSDVVAPAHVGERVEGGAGVAPQPGHELRQHQLADHHVATLTERTHELEGTCVQR